jgi:hypothetical protein
MADKTDSAENGSTAGGRRRPTIAPMTSATAVPMRTAPPMTPLPPLAPKPPPPPEPAAVVPRKKGRLGLWLFLFMVLAGASAGAYYQFLR